MPTSRTAITMNIPSNVVTPSPVHVSLGAYGRLQHLVAVAELVAFPPSDPLMGILSCNQVQIKRTQSSLVSGSRGDAAVMCEHPLRFFMFGI